MHTENEASVNEPQQVRQNKHGRVLGSHMPLKASCSAPGDNRHFPEHDARLFQWETQTPDGTQKEMLVSLPSAKSQEV